MAAVDEPNRGRIHLLATSHTALWKQSAVSLEDDRSSAPTDLVLYSLKLLVIVQLRPSLMR